MTVPSATTPPRAVDVHALPAMLTALRLPTRSLAIAANQPFSAWDRIFHDQAVTVAAIDRLVHHAAILEMNVESYRRRAAADRTAALADNVATTTGDNRPCRVVRNGTPKKGASGYCIRSM